jgi:hypothetical protein
VCSSDLAVLAQIPKVHVGKLDLREEDFTADEETVTDPDCVCDIITMLDIVEHLPKAKALEMLTMAPKVAGLVLAFVPVQTQFPHPEEELLRMQEEFKANNDVLRCHLSCWTPEEMAALGYTVIYDAEYHKRVHGLQHIDGAMICYKRRPA